MRALIKLTIAGLMVFALVRTVPVFWSYVQFRDAVGELARFSAKRTETDVADRVMRLAEQFEVPLDRDDLTVRRERATTYVDATYSTGLEVLPSKFYPWEFAIHVEGTPAPHALVLP
jgi:hypothetical protein